MWIIRAKDWARREGKTIHKPKDWREGGIVEEGTCRREVERSGCPEHQESLWVENQELRRR